MLTAEEFGQELAAIEALADTDPSAAVVRSEALIGSTRGHPEAYRWLGVALRRLERADDAAGAEMASIQASVRDPRVAGASDAIQAGDLPRAENALRSVLQERPNDAAALRMLGEIAAHMGALRDAEGLFRRALELTPSFDYARLHLAAALSAQARPAAALVEIESVGAAMATYPEVKRRRAEYLGQLGEYESAIDLYREVTAEEPGNGEAWSSLAFLLKTIGEPESAIEACRSALAANPADGDAWWMLADLKTYRFTAEEIASIEAAIADPRSTDGSRAALHMALGKAFEDGGNYDRSYAHYQAGNRLRAAELTYDPARLEDFVDRSIALFTPEFLAAHEGQGEPAADPIFVLGLPRSGSTLVEQILASHPLIEGTGELFDLHVVAKSLEPGPQYRAPWSAYPGVLADLSRDRLFSLGRDYLEHSAAQRKTDRPRFIDKMPNNWLHVGLIMLILPNAKIIDARRNPMACGFSNFKQLYARGHEFSYDLNHFAHYYQQYVRLMDHFGQVAPGRVLRVVHESLVADPEPQIRRLLAYVGVPFDPACRDFHKTRRAVRSASAEQVRRPIQPGAAEQWHHYERHLDPLKAALGATLDNWRGDA